MKQTTLGKPPKKKTKVYETNSSELLDDQAFLDNINAYSIRFHVADKRGPHYDFCIGNAGLNGCIDFLIPGKLTKLQESGKRPNLPEPGERARLMLLGPVHETSFLTSPVGKKITIPTGEYGAGKWWNMEIGTAKIIKKDKGYTLWLGKISFHLIPIEGELKKMLIARSKANQGRKNKAMERVSLQTAEFGDILSEIADDYMKSEDKKGYSIQSFLADITFLIHDKFESDANKGIKTAKLIVDETDKLADKLEDQGLIENKSKTKRET